MNRFYLGNESSQVVIVALSTSQYVATKNAFGGARYAHYNQDRQGLIIASPVWRLSNNAISIQTSNK